MAAARIDPYRADLDAKFYAATQVMDERATSRRIRACSTRSFGMAYPITPAEIAARGRAHRSPLGHEYLGMQVLIEGLALAAFQRIRTRPRIARGVDQRVRDAGRKPPRRLRRLALRDYYPRSPRPSGDEPRSRGRGLLSPCATASTKGAVGKTRAAR